MIEFTLPTMTCGHCVRAVTQAVKDAAPQARVEIDLPSHKLQVENAPDREALVKALAEAGYDPA
ncbi:heavy-metal-associated domain-containing protein [Azohydromonas caseinilytica]|uniref:Heavy-metal-associated domain-containing protein n=1 Tax=Azohydromonas caseinilytica TaxID=2728836 RepID=A0A848FJD5_9BURK|nr:heavy-metal-associated domain-containing protein [Azohydromonas caseinilytica]NML18353.1 heavy-metal-associated domain-containing protein [Azohydromonas caseinilytica]